MSHNVLKNIWTKRQDEVGRPLLLALRTQEGDFVDPLTLTDISIRFRLRTDRREDAVTGAGTVEAYDDQENVPALYNAQYLWDTEDPNVPGIYVYEVDALDEDENLVTFPSGQEPYMVRIVEDVGTTPPP